MSKVDDYRDILRGLDSWEPFLLAESNLPGPRANLELAFAVALEGEEADFLSFSNLDEESAPANSKKEFLAFCGVLGLGYLVARGQRQHLVRLRMSASDPRWRIREAVALGLQEYGRQNMDGLLGEMESWMGGNLLERRAVIAAVCEPGLLENPEHTGRVFEFLDWITASLMEVEDRKTKDFKILRKGLAYTWSVAVAAQPEVGKGYMEKWVCSEDETIRWIMKQNLKKKRLVRMDSEWVAAQLELLE
jgi:hypothetical protein